MTRTLNLFISGFVSFASAVIPDREVPVSTRGYSFLPSNTPQEAIAGDMLRVGAQIRLAEKVRESMHQAEFEFTP